MSEIPQVMHAYMNALKAHDVDAIAATLADDLAVILPARTLGKQPFLSFLSGLYAGFPNWHYEHDAPVVQGEIIVVRWRQGGTHTGVFALSGLDPIAPTGRSVKIPDQYFHYTIRSAKIVEIRPEPIPGGAPLGILQQIGVQLPP